MKGDRWIVARITLRFPIRQGQRPGKKIFAGHYAAAFAAKAAEPKAPLWTLVASCQLIDIGWGVFIATGIEHAESDPSLPGSTLVLSHMP